MPSCTSNVSNLISLAVHFTKRYPVEQSVFINPKSCSCRNSKKACKRAVLESRKKPFVVQRHCVDREDEQGLFSWDLAMFRYPRRPEFKQINTVEKMKYLDLEFSSVTGREPCPVCSLSSVLMSHLYPSPFVHDMELCTHDILSFTGGDRTQNQIAQLTPVSAKDEFIRELAELENVRNIGHNRFDLYLRDRKKRALDGEEKPWGPEHTSTLNTVNNLGLLYKDQGKLVEAQKMYERALDGKEGLRGPDPPSTLKTIDNSRFLHSNQGLDEETSKRVLGNPRSPSASTSTSSTNSESSEAASIASVARSGFNKPSVSSGASVTLVAGLDETTKFFLSDEELHNLFAEAFARQNRDKVLRNGARLLKWFGRRLVVSAKKTVEKEAAEFFLSQRHGRSIMDRIARQIPENLTEKNWQGQIAHHQLQSSINRERLETDLQQLTETPSVNVKSRDPSALKTTLIFPDDTESENSIDSEDEQQIGEKETELNFDAAKSFLKSSDAFARLKEELGDFISPFRSKAMWKKTLWIGGQQVYFELPDTAPQRTRIDKLKSALEEHLKMPVLWWPLKQPRKLLSSNKVRMILPCVS